MITGAEKPLVRAGGKGTIVRKRCLDMYRDEVERLYVEFAEKSLRVSDGVSA